MDRAKWDRLFCDGATDDMIADALGVSMRTFKRWKVARRQEDVAIF